MGAQSSIEWTDATWNPWQGCTKVSEACKNCYMFRDKSRYGQDPTIVHRSSPHTFRAPLRKGKNGILPGSKVFTCSWSDWFHEAADPWRPEAWLIIKQRPDLVFQILTKRPERIAQCLPADWGTGYENVWLGTTVENQTAADLRVPQLLRIPAAVRFLSCEPLLGPVDLENLPSVSGIGHFLDCLNDCGARGSDVPYKIDWVICGGESGPYARPTHPDWARSLRDQCEAAGVAFHFKQWGEWFPRDQWEHYPELILPDDGDYEPSPFHATMENDTDMHKVGKVKAGRLLDGREWNQFPKAGVLV